VEKVNRRDFLKVAGAAAIAPLAVGEGLAGESSPAETSPGDGRRQAIILRSYAECFGKYDDKGALTGFKTLDEVLDEVKAGAVDKRQYLPLHVLLRIAQEEEEHSGKPFDQTEFNTRANKVIKKAEAMSNTVHTNLQGVDRREGKAVIGAVNEVFYGGQGVDEHFRVMSDRELLDSGSDKNRGVFEVWGKMSGFCEDLSGAYDTILRAQTEKIPAYSVVVPEHIVHRYGNVYIEHTQNGALVEASDFPKHLEKRGILKASGPAYTRPRPLGPITSELFNYGADIMARSVEKDAPKDTLDRAIKYLNYASELSGDPDSHGALGRALFLRSVDASGGAKLADMKTCEKHILKAVELDPENGNSLETLGELYRIRAGLSENKGDKIKFLKQSGKYFIESIGKRNSASWRALLVGDSDRAKDAVSVYDDLISLDGVKDEYLQGMVDAYDALGNSYTDDPASLAGTCDKKVGFYRRWAKTNPEKIKDALREADNAVKHSKSFGGFKMGTRLLMRGLVHQESGNPKEMGEDFKDGLDILQFKVGDSISDMSEAINKIVSQDPLERLMAGKLPKDMTFSDYLIHQQKIQGLKPVVEEIMKNEQATKAINEVLSESVKD